MALQLAIQHHQGGRLLQAEAIYQQVLQAMPAQADALHLLGLISRQRGNNDIAANLIHRAIEANPAEAIYYNSLGVAVQAQGQLDEAVGAYRNALALKPDYTEALFNLGVALKALGHLDEAAECYRKALTLNPDSATAEYNLGNVLVAQERLDEAVEHYRKALALKPDFADAYFTLGNAFKKQGRLGEAIKSYQQATTLNPNHAEAYSNLGNALQSQGRMGEAIDCFRKALLILPDSSKIYDMLLFTLNFTGSSTPAGLLEIARHYGQLVSRAAGTAYSSWQCDRHPQRLRIGLVSGDLNNHPVGYFLESILGKLDRTRLELVAYPTQAKSDEISERLRPAFSAWTPLHGKSDEAAARQIHADGIHILIDLSGHTQHNRLPLFAWKSAPVQVSWLGYFATTGVAEIDYLLADEIGVPPAHRNQFTEKIWYLPNTRLCFTPPAEAPEVAPSPARLKGHITFGCFQVLAKIEDAALVAWCQILAAIPNARLRIQNPSLGDAATRKHFTARLLQHGIDSSRVDLLGRVPRSEYLQAYADVDLLLDTFPFPGGTTTCEALWMGVPTLTLAGDTLLARQGASLLMAAGLADWIASSKEEYLAKAVAFAADLPKLAALRSALREQVRLSPLFDATLFARNFEDALWGIWQSKDSDSAKN